MVQHLLLADLAPILLLLGLTRAFLRPAVRRLRPVEERLGPLAHPAARWSPTSALMWLWHVPAMYELALDHAWAHALEHASFFTAGHRLLVVPDRAGAAAPPAHGALGARLPERREAADGRARRGARVLADVDLRHLRGRAAHLGPVAARGPERRRPRDDGRAVARARDRLRDLLRADARALGARPAAARAVRGERW